MRSVMAVSGAIASLIAVQTLGASAVSAEADTPTEQATVVEVASVNGSGCPQGSATVTVSADGSTIKLVFSGFAARSGGTAAPTDFRQNCQFNLKIARAGYTYAVDRTDYHGTARLGADSTAQAQALYYFQGSSDTLARPHPFTGPMNQAWAVTDTFDGSSLVYAPCAEQRNLNVNLDLRVNDETTVPPTVEEMRVASDITMHLTWAACG